MVSKSVIIHEKEGFHIRPAQLFCEKAARFESDICVITESGSTADAKSILGLMTLGLQQGSIITIQATGPDEKEALEELVQLLESNEGKSDG